MSWESATAGMVSTVLLGVIVVVVIVQLGATWRARTSASSEAGYRRLAEEAQATQQVLGARLDEVKAELDHLRARSDEMYRMLREVQ
ncbi:MAG: hypothetical protein ABW046_15295 [Actinoplanes sp.]